MAKGSEVKEVKTEEKRIIRPPEIYSSAELQGNWSEIPRNRAKGYWLDSDDSVQATFRLDRDKAPLTLEFFKVVHENISADPVANDPRKYLKGEKYVLLINSEGRNYSAYFDENYPDIPVFNEKNVDTLSWVNYGQEGMKYVMSVLGKDSILKAVIRRPTFKILNEMGVLSAIIKNQGDRKHMSLDVKGV